VLSISYLGLDDMPSYLFRGSRPAPDGALRPILHYLSVQGKLELQWIVLRIHKIHIPGYSRTYLLGAELVRTEINDRRFLVRRHYDERRALPVIKSVLLGMLTVPNLNLYLGFALSCCPGPLFVGLPIGCRKPVQKEPI
jgi:hypothetical protein